jgi:ABC-2 type transport system ATP-binding protein
VKPHAMITVEHLGKRFREVAAVRDVSFNVGKGEVFGFLGPNGAGKSTTINMLCTLLRPTAGRAIINGYDVTQKRNLVRRSIGLVFQETTLDDYLTAEQNLVFHARAYGVPRPVREQRMKELLEMLELWDRRKDSVLTYSGGMKRRLEIVRGLLHHPKVLFLDEPTLGLDPQTRRYIWNYILALRDQEDLTIFMTTHHMDEAEKCDRVAIIDHGQIVALDTPGNLKNAVGGDVVSLAAEDNLGASAELRDRYGLTSKVEDGLVTFSVPNGEQFLAKLVRNFTQPLLSVGIHRPTLEDAFITLTGQAIRNQDADPLAAIRSWRD